MKPSKYILISMAALFFIGGTAGAQNLPNKLKDYLNERSFPDLINSYDQRSVTLYSPGQRERALAAQPYTIGKGFRVQAFAGSQRMNAERVAEELQTLDLDSVYVLETGEGLYKVQMGNFTRRIDAEMLMQKLRYANVPGVWVVEADVHESKSPVSPAPGAEDVAIPLANITPEPIVPPSTLYYTIQIFASGDQEKALALKDKFESELNQPVEVVKQQSFWKVMVGQFETRDEADRYVKTLIKRRFQDAWITQLVRE